MTCRRQKGSNWWHSYQVMSKNNSQTRPGSIRRRRPKPQASTPSAPTKKQSRLRRFLPTVLIPHGVALLLVVIVAVVALMFTATSMVNLPATIAQLWLSLNMGAVSGSGQTISVLPMLPGLLFFWAIAWRVHQAVKDRASIADLFVLLGLTVAAPLILSLVAGAMLLDASAVLNVGVPPVYWLLRILLLHICAMFLGMGPRLWRALARRYGVPEWLVDAGTQARRFVLIFAAVATVIVVIITAVNHQAFGATLAGYEGASIAGLIFLSLLYLPNIVVFCMGVILGAPLSFGEASISLFSVHTVPLPPLPILAALPASAPQWGVALLVIPAVIAAWIFVKNPMRFSVNIATAGFAAMFIVLLGLYAGGVLGVYNYVGLNLLIAGGMVLAYLLIVGLLIFGIDKLRTPVPSEEIEASDDGSEEDSH